jgi:hypothetical protein
MKQRFTASVRAANSVVLVSMINQPEDDQLVIHSSNNTQQPRPISRNRQQLKGIILKIFNR